MAAAAPFREATRYGIKAAFAIVTRVLAPHNCGAERSGIASGSVQVRERGINIRATRVPRA